MAILKRRMMREKKPQEGGASAPSAQADPPVGEVSPSANPPVIPVENGGTSPVETLPDGEIPSGLPAESGITDTNPDTATVQTENASTETSIQPITSPAVPEQQDKKIESLSTPQANQPPRIKQTPTHPPLARPRPLAGRARFSLLQKALMVVVSLSAALLTFSFVLSLKKSTPPAVSIVEPLQANAAQPQLLVSDINNAPAPEADIAGPKTQHNEPTSQNEPLSLQLAEGHYAAKDYVGAYNAYEQLHKNLVGPDFELIRDFLQFRMALCLEKKGYFDKANQIFKAVAESRSIVLRAIANYRGSLLEMNAGQYLNARTRAYKTIALTGALSPTCDWALTLEQDCTFLAAEAVTRQVLSLCDADKELPQEFLSSPEEKDPIAAGLNEAELRTVLTSGIERLNSGLLAPQVRPVESISGSPGLNRWLVVCNGPGIEELIARFAANAALDVRWVRPEDRGQKTEDGGDWNRPVTLYLPAATAQQVAATAAGAAGLLAQIDDARLDEAEPRRAGTITISNPAEYLALSEHSRELSENAMWLWRAFLLMYSNDARIPNVHFALGVLQESRGRLAEAITEYKLVANRYSRTSIAPFALLHSSRLKTSLRDYTGASRDLKQLIEQYPDNVLVGEAHLNLAETTMKAGLYDDACSLYRKVYNLGFSAESQTIAAFGAGSCFYHTKDYESAVKWLTRYFDSLRKQQPAKTTAKLESQNSPDLYTAYLLLGKANLAMGNLEAACDALNRTVRSASASDEYVEAVSALVETQIKQENFVAALGTIENVRAWPFSQEQVTRLLLLKSNVLRAMGLADQAITALTDKVPYLTDSRLKADIMLELARCYVACANLDLAKEHLTEALSLVEPGPVAQQTYLELADVCLKLGDNKQTISICTQLLASSASEQTKQQASKILASAYSRQEDYNKAAEALLAASIKQ